MNLRIIKRLIPLYATHLFACSTQAGEWMYGKRPFSIIPNAIDFQAFRFDLQSRNDIRKSLSIAKDTFVVGHIGRFDYQKNHQFLIKVFTKLLEVSPGAKLVLIGEGNNVDEIRALVSSYRITESVLFLGHRDDIPDLLAAMDCFVLPSHFEGLGIVLLEAQANGLPCVVSSAVPAEVDYSGLVSFIDLCEPLDVWISEIIKARIHRNISQDSAFNTSEYNIVQAAKNLRDKLISVYQNTTR
jgi:glycosyltransferase EpsF